MPLFKNKPESLSAYFLFEKEVRKQVKKQNPKKNDCEISNIIAKMWIEGEPTKRLKYYELEKATKIKIVRNALHK